MGDAARSGPATRRGNDAVLVEVELDGATPQVAYQCLGALSDLALTESAATLAQLEAADLALLELLDSTCASSPITLARLHGGGEELRLELCTGGAPPHLDPTTAAMVQAGYGDISVVGDVITLTLAPPGLPA